MRFALGRHQGQDNSSTLNFSVVTISYNQGEFVGRTIESVISQSGVSIQYIVCDPGSDDGSRNVINSFADKISHIIYEPDRGPADGLNQGFSRASGDIYCYLNSDDIFLPGAFATVAKYFLDNPRVDVVIGHTLVIDRDGQILRRAWSNPYNRIMVAYGDTAHFQPSTFFRSGAFLRTHGFNVANRSAWDAELLVDMYLAGAKIKIIDEFLSGYRLYGDTITNTGAYQSETFQFLRYRFSRLMNRQPNRLDRMLSALLYVARKIFYPKSTFERVKRGRLYRRGAP